MIKAIVVACPVTSLKTGRAAYEYGKKLQSQLSVTRESKTKVFLRCSRAIIRSRLDYPQITRARTKCIVHTDHARSPLFCESLRDLLSINKLRNRPASISVRWRKSNRFVSRSLITNHVRLNVHSRVLKDELDTRRNANSDTILFPLIFINIDICN